MDWLEKPAIQWSSSDDSVHWNGLDKLCGPDGVVTYRALLSLVLKLVAKLKLKCSQEQNCGIPVVVAIPEGPFLPIAILAVHVMNHDSNAVLVPMEPSEGKERLKHMMEDVRPALVLCLPGKDWTKMEQVLQEMDSGLENHVLDGLLRSSTPQLLDFGKLVSEALVGVSRSHLVDASSSLGVWDLLGADDDEKPRISHIVFTSGTTGRSKGCVSSHAALRHYLTVKNEVHKIDSSSVVLLASALSFDPCLSDILATFQAKATLVISPRKLLLQNLAQVLSELRVTHILCTSTLWSMVHPQVVLPDLQVVALGGEPIPKRVVDAWSNRDGIRLCATYGVTEACVYQTMGQITSSAEATGQCVGQAFRGLQIAIVEENNGELMLLDEHCVGEVVLSGAQIDNFSGYLNRQELTARKFLERDGERYYRTGDRGCIRDGSLFVLGRIDGEDGMVKVNGVRVELGEIEAALVDDAVQEDEPSVVVGCLAVVKNAGPSDDASPKQIHAYCVLSEQCIKELKLEWDGISQGVFISSCPLLTLLHMRCSLRVRAGVMPSAFVLIPRIPLSPTGKSDRRQLPQIVDCVSLADLNGSSDAGLLKEYGKSGSVVTDVVVEFLNLQPCQQSMLTTDANFAMLGGDSLTATRVVRTLYANHHRVPNSRHLGGAYGSLEGAFAVSHLLCARNLGEYVDWLDSNSLCHSEVKEEDNIMQQRQTPVFRFKEGNGNDFNQYAALLEATTADQTSLVAGLLGAGVDPNLGGHGGRLGKVSDRNYRKQHFSSNPLHVACSKGNPAIVRALLQKACKLNSPDASGTFPLHMAASGTRGATENVACDQEDRLRTECVRMLLEAGAPISMRDGNKQTVLHAAARAGHCHMLRLLISRWKVKLKTGEVRYNALKHKAGKLDWQDKWFRTPVHWAVLNGKVDALEILMKEGFNPDPPRPKQSTSNRRSNVKIESPLEICERFSAESDDNKWSRIRGLLQDAAPSL